LERRRRFRLLARTRWISPTNICRERERERERLSESGTEGEEEARYGR